MAFYGNNPVKMHLKDLSDLYGEKLHISNVISLRSPRYQDITKRMALDENDGRIIDKHDQFYRDHKLLLTLFRVLGVMPVQRGQIGKITFGWLSSPMIYAYIFYVATTALVLNVGYERLDILLNKSKKFDEYIYSIIFIVFLIPHFTIPYVGWSVAYEVCDYKNFWGKFQLDYYKITGKDMEFPYLSTLIGVISLGCLFLASGFLLTLSALLEGFTLYHTTAYLHVVTTINMNCALWYINCRAIGNASTAVAESFKKDVDQYCTSYIIKYYRCLWLELSDVLQKLGNAYARTYSTYCLLMMTNITVSVYGFTSEVVDHGLKFTFKEVGLLVDAVYCFTLLYIFCDCSHYASSNISDRVQWCLMDLKLNTVDQATAKEVQLFLAAIHMNPPKVSLRGYAVVNRQLLSSGIATIAIYLIVLLQFKISLVNLTS
ncbi:gustatory and odorant receptor 22-like [Cylas formicarius]|uniref:gustatory and odorant receptor 22-like n=1 Tax=Cylas formicarius TaxID=197179 RepID=UPI00295883D1|nr:gustatory and odorant receptor 22-like [Cylas formicarius]